MYKVSVFPLFLILFFAFSCSPKRARNEVSISSTQEAKRAPSPLIVLDPGHGGSDEGTKSKKDPVYLEKGFNLVLARQVDKYLKEWGYRTFFTRTSDVFVPLKERAQMANRLRADLFVSLHFNAAEASSAHGIEVFYPDAKKNPSRKSASFDLASTILEKLLEETGAHSRGVKIGDFCVIRETHMPAVLVESGFLTNDHELKRILHEPDYFPKKIAWGIAQGIHAFLQAQ